MSCRPVAYTYDADYHCPACAISRFGSDDHGHVIEDATDSESNPVGVVAPWDEWHQGTGECETLACSDCRAVLDEYHVTPWGDYCDASDTYDACTLDLDNPVVVRDTGGSIPRSLAEWVDTIIGDAESVGADVSKIRTELEDLAENENDYSIDPFETARDMQSDVEDAINATDDYVVVDDSDAQSWCIYRRKAIAETIPQEG